jgi:hypothetical protein
MFLPGSLVCRSGRVWAFRDYALSEIFDIYFTSVLGIPPMWTVLAFGLLIPAAAAIRRSLHFGA